ncbi:hypothetical protein QFZ32_009160 [Streptomyces canus]|nr:hypothetical protein [Streptomyces canus]MDQ1073632.1 hypothetical protein [Streptomyces canus]
MEDVLDLVVPYARRRRLTIRKAEKNAAFRRLALAAEGYCIHAKCRHRPAHAGGVLRTGPLTAQSVSGAQCTLFAPPLWPAIRPQ